MSLFSDSPEDRERVRSKIIKAILAHYSPGKSFHMVELTDFVANRFNGYVAPDSPGRIMRLLKQQGVINYTLLSRSSSHYRWEEQTK